MKILERIVKLGDPILRKNAKKVENPQSKQVLKFIDEMLLILSNSKGVGLAAPQISESVCIMIIASRPSKRYPQAPEMEPVVMINPEYEVLSGELIKEWEGCLSVPGVRALVPRYTKIKITYLDQRGSIQKLVAEDFIARIFQHEYDHFNGLVFLDRVCSNKDIISEEEFQKLMG